MISTTAIAIKELPIAAKDPHQLFLLKNEPAPGARSSGRVVPGDVHRVRLVAIKEGVGAAKPARHVRIRFFEPIREDPLPGPRRRLSRVRPPR